MELGAAGLREQPFPTHGKPLAIIPFDSQRAALNALQETHEHHTGLSLLQGPVLAGKSTLIRNFIESREPDNAVALVDGRDLNTTRLLHEVLRQFGYDIELSSANELLGLVRVFVLHQASISKPPLLIIENTHELRPSALRVLCELAELRSRSGSALKIILVSDHSLGNIMKAPAMKSIAKRILHDFHLRPMTSDEARNYVHDKLIAAGTDSPESIFPAKVCDELWKASGGWPGILDRIALLALSKARCIPVESDMVEHPVLPVGTWDNADPTAAGKRSAPPQLIVTNNGSVMQELTMEKTRTLIGRSEHNDIAISSRFISRYHALMVRHGSAIFLMDLNSTNGTLVNGKRVSNHVLRHDDVITVGYHRIKFSDPFAIMRGELEREDFADTAVMKTLEDMRSLLAKENTTLLPTGTENLPTLQS